MFKFRFRFEFKARQPMLAASRAAPVVPAFTKSDLVLYATLESCARIVMFY